MAGKFTVMGPDGEMIAVGDDVEEVAEHLREKAGLKDPEELAEDYDAF